MTSNQSTSDITPQDGELVAGIQRTADYLYKIDGDVPPEIGEAIARLRQLINEAFIGRDGKTVGSQIIYDILNPALIAYMERDRQQLVEQYITDNYGERCETKDTQDFPGIDSDPKATRCLTCEQWEIYDNWLATLKASLPIQSEEKQG